MCVLEVTIIAELQKIPKICKDNEFNDELIDVTMKAMPKSGKPIFCSKASKRLRLYQFCNFADVGKYRQ